MDAHARVRELLAHYDYLPPGERDEVDAHLAACPQCASAAAALRQTPAPPPALRPDPVIPPASPAQPAPLPEPEPVEPSAARPPFPWPRLLLPLGFVLLFVLSIWFSLGGWPGLTRRVPAPSGPTPVNPTPLAPAPTTITFACDDVTAAYRDYAEIASAFQRDNPGIKVELKSYRDLLGSGGGSGSYLQVMQEVAANADVFCVWDISPLVEAHLLYNLDPLIARDASFQPDDFYPAVLSTVRDRSSLYAVPSRFQPALIRYDPAAFAAAGIPAPHPGWTWDDFLTSAVALTRRAGGDTVRWGFGEDSGLLFSARYLAALDDPAFLAAASSTNALADTRVVALLRWYKRLYVDARAAIVPRTYEWSGGAFEPVYVDPDQISQGKMAMWTDLLYLGAPRQGKPAPFPIAVSDSARPNGGSAPIYTNPAWAMAAETLHPDAAWRWLNYLSHHPPPDVNHVRLPARRSLVAQAAFWNALPSDEAAVYRYILDHLAAPAREPLAPRVQALYDGLRQMVTGEVPLVDAFIRRTSAGRSVSTAPPEPTIRFAAPRDDLPAYLSLALDFEREQGTHVQLVACEDLIDALQPDPPVLWNEMRVLARRVDVMLDPQVPQLVRSGRSQGILYDVTELIGATLRTDDYYANTLEALQWRGRTWGLPGRFGLELIHYRQALFDQLNVPYPQLGWTWRDFDRTVRAVAFARGSNAAWWGFKERSSSPLQLLRIRAGPLVTYTAPRAVPVLDTPLAIQLADWYAGLLKDRAIAPADRAADDAAMWIGLTDPSVMAVLDGVGVGVAPFPVGPGSTGTTPLELYDAYAMSATTPRPHEAWQWLLYLQAHPPPDQQQGGIPARRATAQDADLSPDPTLRAVIAYALAHTQAPAPLRPEEYLVTQHLATALQQIVGGQPPALALKEAQDGVRAVLGLEK